MAINYDIILNFVTKMNGSDSPTSFGKEVQRSSKPAVKATKQIDDGFSAMFERISDVSKLQSAMFKNAGFAKMGVDVSALNFEANRFGKSLGLSDDVLKNMTHSADKMSQRFDMNMLSVLFFGMQIQRTFQGIFNSMLNTFKLIDKKGIMPLNRGLTRLEAAFSFLSFSILKAMEPLLLPIVDSVVKMIDWFSQLPDPVKQAAGALVIFGIGVGTVLSLVGNLSLGVMGLKGLFGDLAFILPKVSESIATLGGASSFGSLGALAGIAIIAAAALLVFKAGLDGISEHPEETANMLDRIGRAFSDLVEAMFGVDIKFTETQNILDVFWSGLKTGVTAVIQTVGILVDELLRLQKLIFDLSKIPGDTLTNLLSGKGFGLDQKATEISEDVGNILIDANSYWQDLMAIGAKDAGDKFSQGLVDTQPLLNDTTTQVFTESSQIMKDVVHQAVEETIADTNRAIAALRSLEAKRSAALSSSSVSNKSTNNTFNISSASGTNITNAIRNANIAVPTRF